MTVVAFRYSGHFGTFGTLVICDCCGKLSGKINLKIALSLKSYLSSVVILVWQSGMPFGDSVVTSSVVKQLWAICETTTVSW